MVADQPLVVSNYNDTEKVHDRNSLDNLSERWKKKHEGKSVVGKKISLGDYINDRTKI